MKIILRSPILLKPQGRNCSNSRNRNTKQAMLPLQWLSPWNAGLTLSSSAMKETRHDCFEKWGSILDYSAMNLEQGQHFITGKTTNCFLEILWLM